ncbi:MAG: S8 family serine peptidase, partial [Chloroflexi bacterium]|nr:S8 family serine peptidase [Chloroflexota bacterium]
QPAYKLDPALRSASGLQLLQVELFPLLPGEVEPLRARLEAHGVQPAGRDEADDSGEWGRYLRLQASAEALPWLLAQPEVLWVEPYRAPVLFNDVARSGEALQVDAVWEGLGLYGSGQTLGICDTGLDVGSLSKLSLDFQGRVVATYALGRAGDWSDDHGHGTHVAGSAVGSGVLSGADPTKQRYAGSFAGVAPEANLVFQSALDRFGGLTGIPADLGELLGSAYGHGARVHGNSWGADANVYDSMARQVDAFVWEQPEMLVVLAAGNSGADGDGDGAVDLGSLGTPATAKNALTVGASESLRLSGLPGFSVTYGAAWPSDFPVPPLRDDRMADQPAGLTAFSSRGPTADGRIKPDLVAPGSWILSARSHDEKTLRANCANYWSCTPANSHYAFNGGTSMAAPLAAGSALLARQWLVERQGAPNPSAALVKVLLIGGARDLSPGQYDVAPPEVQGRPDFGQGWGRLDLAASLMPQGSTVAWWDDHSDGLTTGQAVRYQSASETPLWAGAAGGALRVTLVWSDAPAVSAAAAHLVNDLDLQVIGPDGASYWGNGGSGPDRLNNVEAVQLDGVRPGSYQVVVQAQRVAVGRQPYALVVSGALSNASPTVPPSPTPSPTDTAWLPPSPTATASPTDTGAPAPTGTPTAPPSATHTATDAPSPLPSATHTVAAAPTATLTASPSPTPAWVCQERLVNGGFEEGGLAWVQDSEYDLISPYNPRSGDYSAYLGGYFEADERMRQSVVLPSQAGEVWLDYWWSGATDVTNGQAVDFLTVEVLDLGGAVLRRLESLTNREADLEWHQARFPLAGLAGRPVQVSFHVVTGPDSSSSFFIDDVSVQTCVWGPGATPTPTPTLPLSPTPTQAPPSERVVDDLDAGFRREGLRDGWQEGSGGVAGRFWWVEAQTGPLQRWAEWRPDLEACGLYAVEASVPPLGQDTEHAHYEIAHAAGVASVAANQAAAAGEWVPLGWYAFGGGGGDEWVRLSDVTEDAATGRRVAFDAVRWRLEGPCPTATPTATLTATALPTDWSRRGFLPLLMRRGAG